MEILAAKIGLLRGKTDYMTFNQKANAALRLINGSKLEHGEDFRYPGIWARSSDIKIRKAFQPNLKLKC